jgi:ResB-like family
MSDERFNFSALIPHPSSGLILMIKKIVKYLSSLRFTLLLISLLGAMFLAGLWIPQKSLLTPAMYSQWKHNSPSLVAFFESFGFTSIYVSPLMLTLWALFFLNLSLVMWQRLPLIKKRISLPENRLFDPATAAGYPFRASFDLPKEVNGATVISFLRKHGYTVVGESAGFYGVKNRLSPIAFGLFHISFFLILLGGLTSVYTKFVGVLELAEGESFQGELASYVPTPQMPKIGVPPRAAFTVKSIDPQITNGTPTGLLVRLVDARGEAHEVNVNRPYKVDNSSFLVDNYGVAPLFIVKDSSGKEIDGAYVKLKVLKGKEDVFSLAGFHFRARFYPDYILNNGAATTRSEELRNPVFGIAVEREGKPIAQGVVPKKGALPFAGYQLVMQEMPLWVRVTVFKEYGLSVIYAGFAIASLAVVWRFLLYRREIIGAVREQNGGLRLQVAGRSEFYKSLAEDDFMALFSKLTGKSGRTDT